MAAEGGGDHQPQESTLELTTWQQQQGTEEVTEHLLKIPDDFDGLQNNSNSNIMQQHQLQKQQLQKRSSSAKISIQSLERVVELDNHILTNISVDIQAGQVVGIIGPSGSGKSTLLRAINRLWEPPGDSIFLDGEDITKLNVLAVRRRIGMLFQTPLLFDGTVADNVAYGPRLQGKRLTDAEIEGYLRQADLDVSFAKKSIIGLSVGQAQRVALARTLANQPEVLLLDEPTSALDPVSTRHIEESVMHLCKSTGLTVIMVSHSIEQVKRMADLVCLVVAGELIEVLKPTELVCARNPRAQEYLRAAQQQ